MQSGWSHEEPACFAWYDMTMDTQTTDFLQTDITTLMLPAAKVAFVGPDHSLEHALLVLIKSGYSAIPVLDLTSKVHGIISKTLILDSILGLDRFDVEALSHRTVNEVMSQTVAKIPEDASFFRALELSINQPFVCVEDETFTFVGLLTRRSILATMYQSIRQTLPASALKSGNKHGHS